MTIIYAGQLVSSTISQEDLRDWLKDNNFPRTNLAGRKIYLCPKKHTPQLESKGAIKLPRHVFNAASFWSEAGKDLKLKSPNSALLEADIVKVREITRDGRVVIVHPRYRGGTAFVEVEDLAPLK